MVVVVPIQEWKAIGVVVEVKKNLKKAVAKNAYILNTDIANQKLIMGLICKNES